METDSVEYIVEFNRLNIVPFEYTTELELYSGYGIPPFDEDEYNNFKKEIDCAESSKMYLLSKYIYNITNNFYLGVMNPTKEELEHLLFSVDIKDKGGNVLFNSTEFNALILDSYKGNGDVCCKIIKAKDIYSKETIEKMYVNYFCLFIRLYFKDVSRRKNCIVSSKEQILIRKILEFWDITPAIISPPRFRQLTQDISNTTNLAGSVINGRLLPIKFVPFSVSLQHNL